MNEDIEKNNEQKAQKIKTTTRTNLFQRLAARFGFGARKQSKDQSQVFLIKKPTQAQLDAKDTKEEVDLISKIFKSGKLSSTVEDLFQYWIEDTQNTYRNVNEREERLNALTYMCDNEGLVKNAVTLVASEVAALTENTAFTVISEDENWQKEKNILLKDVWHYDKPTIYSLGWDIFLYGEAFQGAEMSSAGIVNVTTVKPNEILERLEFKPSEVMNFQAQMNNNSGYSTGFSVNLTMPTNGSFAQNNLSFESSRHITYKSSSDLLKDYINNLADISSTEYFTSHLLGFRLANDTLVAPWQVIHFRYNENVSEFWPYGQPPLISCLSAYKQLQRVMGLDDLKTLLSMPIYMYKVKTNGATTARAFDIVNDVKEDFENVGLMSTSAGIEGPSLCTNIWTSDDLVTVEKVNGESNSDSGSTDKMKFFYNRLSSSTGIPLTYLDPTAEGFQMSGVALATLYRPFKTLVDNIRAIIIKEVEDRIRLHDSIRNIKTPDFVLSMNVENPVDKDDLNSKFGLVDKVLEEISNLLGIEAASLPQQIKKDILMKYANLSQEELDKYIQLSQTEKEMKVEEPAASQADVDSSFGDDLAAESEPESEPEVAEESFIKDKKRRLIETRYKNLSSNSILYKLTESLGKLQLSKQTLDFSDSYNSKINKEVAVFIKEHVSLKKGKKRLSN